MKIYTKTGDAGKTSLFGGGRVAKNNLRVEAYGTVDELNAFVGLLRDMIGIEDYKIFLEKIQNELFVIGSLLASTSDKSNYLPELNETSIHAIENQIDSMETELPALKNFILPGGHVINSYCHIARTVCRRAERNVVALSAKKNTNTNPIILTYLNRLSDYFFVLARMMSLKLDVPEMEWQK